MLKVFRQKYVSKLILWGLLILILPAFVLWGTSSVSRSKEKGPKFVGIIYDKKVSFEDFFKAFTGVRCQVILNYFNQSQLLDNFLDKKELLAKLAWDRLLMLEEARLFKITVDDADVVHFIKTHPLFTRNGAFDEKFYAYVLKNSIGVEPRSFEEIIRDNLKLQKLRDLLTQGMHITDMEVVAEYRKEFEQFKIAYILIESKDFLNKVSVDDAAVKDFYEKHKTELLLKPKPEEKEAGPGRPATFDEAKSDIQAFLADEKARKLAFQYAENIHKQISDLMEKNRETFETAASALDLKVQTSQLFSKSDYLEGIGEANTITEAAVALQEHQISGPVETRKGALIFEILESKKIDEEKFKKEKENYTKKVFEEKKTKFLERWLRNLEQKAKLEINLDEIDKYYRY